MYSKRKWKRRHVRRWDYMWISPEAPSIRGGWWVRRRLCSQYNDDGQNWLYSSYPYFKAVDAYYQELWDEYYASRL